MIIGLLWTLFMGGLAGWIAGKLMGSEGSMGRNIILGLVGEVAFLQFHDAAHQRMMQMELQFGVVTKIVCHILC